MQASRLQLEELQRKLRLAANTRASDAPGYGHAQQAPSEGQEATAPSQPALRADCSGPQGTNKAPVNAASSGDVAPELPHARAASSSPDPARQVDADAAMGSAPNAQQTEDRVMVAHSESAGQLGTESAAARAPTSEDAKALALTLAAEPLTRSMAAPSATHTPTPPQGAAESPEQPVSSSLNAPDASPSNAEAQQPQVACADGLSITTLPGLAKASGKAVSNQAALQEASEPMQPLLGLSSVTPLPPPVLSPTRAVPNTLTAALQSPMGPLPETGQSGLLGWTAVTPLPPPILSPTAAQGQASATHQTSSSPASLPAAIALNASDVGQQPAHALPLSAQTSPMPAQFSPLPAQALPIPVQASSLPAQISALPTHTSAPSAQASPLLAQASPLPGASAGLHKIAGDTALLPQQLPAAALQPPSIGVAALPSCSAREAGARTDEHDIDLIDQSAPGEEESGGAVDAQEAASPPIPDGVSHVCLHG